MQVLQGKNKSSWDSYADAADNADDADAEGEADADTSTDTDDAGPTGLVERKGERERTSRFGGWGLSVGPGG